MSSFFQVLIKLENYEKLRLITSKIIISWQVYKGLTLIMYYIFSGDSIFYQNKNFSRIPKIIRV